MLDARSRTKVWLDTYLLEANITKDDDTTLASFIVTYGFPNYPLTRVFNDKNVDLIYSVGTPESRMLKVGVEYEEIVPTIISCVTKTGITGTLLRWKGEAELRRVFETYPLGSLRILERMMDNEERLGGTTVYSVIYTLRYVRFTS